MPFSAVGPEGLCGIESVIQDKNQTSLREATEILELFVTAA